MAIYNFSAGPAMLPKEVMELAQSEFCNYQNSGCGILELSHRGKLFEPVRDRAENNIRELMNISDDYEVLFIQGGASLQFSMLAMNLLNGGVGDYADTGVWADKAAAEAVNFGTANKVCSSKAQKYSFIPKFADWKLTPGAAYLHITSNNTVAGTQYHTFPTPPAGVPMLADMSSDIMSKVIDVNQFGLIYAGAQKNIGPSGLAVVILRRDLMARTKSCVPTMLQYKTYAENQSMFNTPPTFAIYMLALVTDHFKKMGGISAIEKINNAKAARLYGYLDACDFYATPVVKEDRSKMNVVFRTPSEELDKEFVKQSAAAGLMELKGHRIVGGCRASIYNAMPMEGVEALIAFMTEFARRNG